MLGEPKKAIRSMIGAMILAMAVMQANSFVDTFWISGLGAGPSSAVSTVSPMYFLIASVGIGLGVGATARVSFHLGRHEHEAAERLAGNAVTLSILISAAVSAVIFLLYDVFIAIMGAQDIRDDGFSYMLPLFLASPVLVLSSALSGIMRGEGAAKKSMAVQISAALFNMAIDPLLIYGAGMGIAGAGLSTGISAFLALLIGFQWYGRGTMAVRIRRKYLRPDRESSGEILGIGGPRAIESMVSSLSDILQRTFIIIAGGTNAIMYYNYAWRYIGIGNLPSQATSSAMVPVASASLGQNDMEKAETAYSYALKLSLAASSAGALIMSAFAGPLMAILTMEESMAVLRPEFAWTLMVGCWCAPFSAMMGIGSSMLQSLSRSRVSMYYHFFWMVLKLAMYAAVCGISFHALIYCMVAVHVIGGLSLLYLGRREFGKARERSKAEAAAVCGGK